MNPSGPRIRQRHTFARFSFPGICQQGSVYILDASKSTLSCLLRYGPGSLRTFITIRLVPIMNPTTIPISIQYHCTIYPPGYFSKFFPSIFSKIFFLFLVCIIHDLRRSILSGISLYSLFIAFLEHLQQVCLHDGCPK